MRSLQRSQPVTTDVITLEEYGEAEIELAATEAQRLRTLAQDRIAVQLGESPGSWRIKASSYVGTVVLPTLKVLIKPKIATANLFYLLEADSRPLDVGQELFDYEQTNDLMAAFATFFAHRPDDRLVGAGKLFLGREATKAETQGAVRQFVVQSQCA